ncbi:MAG: NADH:flavin oxidoreductase/NADH oxidase [Armatimonadetes bacterium]|nr:NADH:flavin oxidoreductase/NADH oxidase [Armatimonadota bacterium]
MSQLFSPLTIRGSTLRNRIALSPMCTYSSEDGFASDWHLVHLGTRASGGCGIVMCEATAVHPDGRISPQDLGIWKDEHIPGLRRVTDFIRSQGAASAIQLAHAGRKAGTYRPWSEVRGFIPIEDGGWERIGPSPIPFRDGAPTPVEMTQQDLSDFIEDFVAAIRRSDEAGFDVVEIHSAHGYLLHQFLSPISNHRSDAYGGDFKGCTRLHHELVEAVRHAWPETKPLFIRISATDWVDGGWTIEESIELAKSLKSLGVDLMDCSSGGSTPDAQIPVGPGYQVPFAERISREAGILSGAVGMITEPKQAEEIVSSGQADLVFLGRELLRNPYWAHIAAQELGARPNWPNQYAWSVG